MPGKCSLVGLIVWDTRLSVACIPYDYRPGRTPVGCGRVVGGIWFVFGSIPNGAGTMVLRCFLFSVMMFEELILVMRPLTLETRSPSGYGLSAKGCYSTRSATLFLDFFYPTFSFNPPFG